MSLKESLGKWGAKNWIVPAVILALGLFASTLAGCNKVLGATKAQASTAAAPMSTTVAPPPPETVVVEAYYNYLTCDGMPAEQAPGCEGLLIWPLTAEARQLIGGQTGVDGGINKNTSRSLATQLTTQFTGVNQCDLYLRLEDWRSPSTGLVVDNRRTLQKGPGGNAAKLVDCSAKAGGA